MVNFHEGLSGFDDLKPDGNEKNGKEEISLSSSSRDKPVEGLGAPGSDMPRAESFYSNMRDYVIEVFGKVAEGKSSEIRGEHILGWSEEFLSVLNGSICMDDLIRLVFQHDEYKENYLYTHSVNVCLLTVKLSKALNFSKDVLFQMFIASLFHDIGMMRIPREVWNTEERLSHENTEKIHEHGPLGKEIFDGLSGIDDVIGVIIGQHHERIDGTGYPHHLTKNEIHYGARLLALVDRYEAQTHTRLWKPRYLPDKAIQLILDNESRTFDSHYIKALLKHISIFPIGTFVRISSGETGQVIKTNEATPMRPVISVMYDRDNRKREEARTVDLSKQLLIHAEHCVDKNDLEDR
ncbi:MAG: HD domain-containing protein [Candidatus Omnitrophica bacterium]|nr:HD domain-containing protein [Candidatus Omnitrophota bacterium]